MHATGHCRRRIARDKEHVKGALDQAKGAIKETGDKMTGDKGLQVEGKFDKAKGAAHKAVGDAKDVLRGARAPIDDEPSVGDE